MEVTFVLQDKTSRTIEPELGVKLMEAAVDNAIPGIDGDCGGEAACATCHVYVRLSCQIITREALDGLVVEVVGS
jgi:2Fe-2S ferredoxin